MQHAGFDDDARREAHLADTDARKSAPDWFLDRLEESLNNLDSLALTGLDWNARTAWLQGGHLAFGTPALTLQAFRHDAGARVAKTGAVSWAYRVDQQSLRRQAEALCREVAARLAPFEAEVLRVLDGAEPPRSLGHAAALGVLRNDFRRLSRGPRIDYPVMVNLESYASCPARCTFCTYPTLDRKGTRMSDALLDKILTDLEAIPPHIAYALCPFLLSEPFADRRLPAILERAEKRLPNAGIYLITTATLLDQKRLELLQARRNIREVCVSLNFSDPVEYEQEMGIPWQRTWQNVLALNRAALAGELGFTLVASRVTTGDALDEHFRSFVRKELPAFEVRMSDRHGWLGRIPAPPRDLDDFPCTQWFEIKIAATGEVALCCQDSHAEHSLGNVTTATVLQIYNEPSARARRQELTARKHFGSCKGCSFSRIVGSMDGDYFATGG